jgi:hypothetical protein
MTFFNLIIAITVLALLALTLYFKLIGARASTYGEDLPKLPMTLLQKRAWFGLGIGLIVLAGAVALVLLRGPAHVFEDDSSRYTFYALIGGGGLLWLLVYLITRQPSGVPMDERDIAILAHAPAIQSGLMLVSLGVWMIGLTEYYRGEGAIPLVFASLIFWSSWIMHMLGLSIGVLVGYRRSRTHA